MTLSAFQQNIPSALAALGLGLILGRFVMPYLAELAIKSSYRTMDDGPGCEVTESQSEAYYTPARQFLNFMLVASAVCPALITLIVGPTQIGFSLSVYLLSLILLTGINLEHLLLPDSIVLTSLWSGLLYHSIFGHANEFVFGVILAYIFGLVFYSSMKHRTGREPIGRGDIKCFSITGAWLGCGALPTFFVAFFSLSILIGIRAAFKQTGGMLPSGLLHLTSAAIAVGTIVMDAS